MAHYNAPLLMRTAAARLHLQYRLLFREVYRVVIYDGSKQFQYRVGDCREATLFFVQADSSSSRLTRHYFLYGAGRRSGSRVRTDL